MLFRKTSAAARELSVPYWTLIGLLRYGKIDPPGKDTSGDYVWTEADMSRARQAIAKRAGRKVNAAAGEAAHA